MTIPFLQETKEGTLLTIHVQPNASRTECAGFHGGAVKIRLAAPPRDGAANEALIEYLARRCAIPRAHVRIESGAGARRKRLYLKGISAEAVRIRLQLPGEGV